MDVCNFITFSIISVSVCQREYTCISMGMQKRWCVCVMWLYDDALLNMCVYGPPGLLLPCPITMAKSKEAERLQLHL